MIAIFNISAIIAVSVEITGRRGMEELKLRYVREHLQESLEDIENGNVENGDAFFRDLMAGKYDRT